MAAVKGGLGRGLQALFGDDAPMVARQGAGAQHGSPAHGARLIDMGQIVSNPMQPRQVFAPEALAELAESIRNQGVLQPILVRPIKEEGKSQFQIVAGERRWRASQLAGLTQIPAMVRELTDAEGMAIALIENLQREDLNPIEEAKGCERLIQEFGLTQEDLAKQLSKSRSTLSNTLRLLSLPQNAQMDIQEGRLSAGHGRSIMSLDEEAREPFRLRMLELSMSVRQAEAESAYFKAHGRFPESGAFLDSRVQAKAEKRSKRAREPKYIDEELRQLKNRMDEILGLKITVSGNMERGVISFHFQNQAELTRLAEQLQLGAIAG